MGTLVLRAKDLLERGRATRALPRSDPRRAAEMILQHGEFLELLPELLAYLEGYRTEHLTLTSLVYELLGTVTGNSTGPVNWMTELPPGTAPAFRRVLNRTIAHLTGEKHANRR